MPAKKADTNGNDFFVKLDKAAAAWHYAEITNPHSKAEYARMWSIEKKRYNLREYADSTKGGYNRTDFLPAAYEVTRKYYEPRLQIDQDTAGDWEWRDKLMASNTNYRIDAFENIFDANSRRDLALQGITNSTVTADLQVAARWYPQWTVDWNRTANVAFFLLSALFELSRKGQSWLQYGHMLILEADHSRTQDTPASCFSAEFITKIGGAAAIDKQRKDLQVERVADYKFPSAYNWTFQTGLDIDDPEVRPRTDRPVEGGADLLTQECYGALALAYDGNSVGAASVDRYDDNAPKNQTNNVGIITGWEHCNIHNAGVVHNKKQAEDNGTFTDAKDTWTKFSSAMKSKNGDQWKEQVQFLGFRWKDLVEKDEQAKKVGNAHKFDADNKAKLAPGRLACNKQLKNVFGLLHDEPEFDNANYYKLFGAWIDTNSSTSDGTSYPGMTQWEFEPVQNCFDFDGVPNKSGFALLYLEARVRSKRGAQALKSVSSAKKSGNRWAGWVADMLNEEEIKAVQEELPTHVEPELHDGKVVFTSKFGKTGPNPVVNKATNLNQPQEGHWMRCGRLTTQDDAAAKFGEGRDYWINGFSPASGTVSGWILGDDGVHHEVWFSSAKTAEEETNRALYAGRPPYQLINTLPKGSIIEDESLLRDDVPWTGPNFEVGGYGDYSDYDDYGYGDYDDYGYSGYSGYSGYGYSY